MDKGQKESLLNSLIGTPEVSVELKTKTIVLFFSCLVISMIIIFLSHEIIRKS